MCGATRHCPETAISITSAADLDIGYAGGKSPYAGKNVPPHAGIYAMGGGMVGLNRRTGYRRQRWRYR